MKILFLTFYFEPDLCAGSFRNTPLFRELLRQMNEKDWIHVITTQPNRYQSFHVEGQAREIGDNYRIDRIRIPEHKSGFVDQARSFRFIKRRCDWREKSVMIWCMLLLQDCLLLF